jgi:diacylglycerol kinase family enzyme
MSDGLLDVCLFEAPPGLLPAAQKAVFLRQLGAMAFGRHQDDPDVRTFCARRIHLLADRDAAVQIDGDACGTTPLVVEVAPQVLPVRVPGFGQSNRPSPKSASRP